MIFIFALFSRKEAMTIMQGFDYARERKKIKMYDDKQDREFAIADERVNSHSVCFSV